MGNQSAEEKKVRCCNPDCRKVIGILKKDILEIKCRHCGAINQWDTKGKRIKGCIKATKRVTGKKKPTD